MEGPSTGPGPAQANPSFGAAGPHHDAGLFELGVHAVLALPALVNLEALGGRQLSSQAVLVGALAGATAACAAPPGAAAAAAVALVGVLRTLALAGVERCLLAGGALAAGAARAARGAAAGGCGGRTASAAAAAAVAAQACQPAPSPPAPPTAPTHLATASS